MGKAMIGHTGFVGGNLARQSAFEHGFNSKNFSDMAGRDFDEVVCAGLTAVKWMANREPEKDRAGIEALAGVLSEVRARRFVLISTVDVYPVSRGEDESFDCISKENHAYGANRLWFEGFCRDRFEECFVIRLPGLFGDGLKKNVIYDLLNDNCLGAINPRSSFQYYDVSTLWADLRRVVEADVRLVNLVTEPVATSAILEGYFSGKAVGSDPEPEVHYDLLTRHAGLWGRKGPYIQGRDEVLRCMGAFVSRARRGTA